MLEVMVQLKNRLERQIALRLRTANLCLTWYARTTGYAAKRERIKCCLFPPNLDVSLYLAIFSDA
jgi:hypothetical protein